jgi:hypothetical protein
MNFTPLVSPAVTPIDPNLRIPEPTVPAEYFSPLTSPAIEAQNMHARSRHNQHFSNPASGSITSPEDPSSLTQRKPVPTPTLPSSASTGARKDNRKAPALGKGSGRTVRQSPHMKPQRRRKQSSLSMSPATLTGLAEQSQSAMARADSSPTLHGPSANSDGSGHSSISPEPISDALMPPPSLPKTIRKSPNLVADRQRTPSNEAVTPATLMRLHSQASSPTTDPQGSCHTYAANGGFMDDLMLPDSAASTGTSPLMIDTENTVAQDENTPTLSAKTPKLSATSTPRTSAQRSQVKSPSAETASKQMESQAALTNKTRQAGATSHVSPAIRPKISPSIQPLIPPSSKCFPLGSCAYRHAN